MTSIEWGRCIPICVLHHNEPHYLSQCLEALKANTLFGHSIFVVDNASDEGVRIEVSRLCDAYPNVTLIENPKNNWVYGFNLVNYDEFQSPYVVLTDADIVVPRPIGGECWLGHLVSLLDKNICIGKCGLGLDLTSLEREKSLERLYHRELGFHNLRRASIAGCAVAPVDSTLAIYRKDLFIGKFKMCVGHASMVRPNYYVCRTVSPWLAQHLGWQTYKDVTVDAESHLDFFKEKLRFCGRYGISVDPSLLSKASKIAQWQYRFNLVASRMFYGVNVLIKWTLFLFLTLPWKLNHVRGY